MSIRTNAPSLRDHTIATCWEHLTNILDASEDLLGLFADLDRLPDGVANDAVRLLGRLDSELGDLVQRIGEAGPVGE